ncbi:MAG: FtsX-like permease family protein [Fervidicoccaceae archaeon]
MRARDLVGLSWRQLRERRLRSILTVLAVSVGVVMIIALSSITGGIAREVEKRLIALGPETVIVSQRGSSLLTDADVAVVKSVPRVKSVIPLRTLVAQAPWKDSALTIVGISPGDLAKLLGELKLAEGSLYLDAPAPLAVAGSNALIDDRSGQRAFSTNQPVSLNVGGRIVVLNVVGVLEPYGSFLGGIPVDDAIFVSASYAETIARGAGYNMLIVKAESVDSVDEVAESLSVILRGRASVTSLRQMVSQVGQVMGYISMLLIGIASTSFVAAGLGTLNIMMVSVLERTREIGVLKALGMRDGDVMMLFVSQGLIIGLLGFAVGLPSGVAAAHLIIRGLGSLLGAGFGGSPRPGGASQFALSVSPAFDPIYVTLAAIASILVTAIASIYPSWRAARLDPVRALRYE